MPTGNLPSSGKKLWEEVHKKALEGSCKDAKDPEACAAGSAWTAVKNAGWKKGEDGQWTKKAELTEFSLTITKASYDKPTNTMRWLASASDVTDDSRGDNMTMELFSDFLRRIEADELAPEEFRSDFWEGGMPYLSISHYPDLNGSGVPGNIEAVYIDGEYLKAKGTYADTPLGRACWKSINYDLYNPERSEAQDKVRISIAFLDWKHKHKSNGFIFERSSLDDFCPECLREIILGEYAGITYLSGQLVHLAHTRVPINKRTLMEVDRAMTTRKEDAASIVGDELANELEQNKKKLVGKSEAEESFDSTALIIKADDQEDTTQTPEPIIEEAKTKKDKPMDGEEEDSEDCPPDKKEKMKSEAVEVDKGYIGEVAVVGEPVYYRPFGGATSMKDAKAVIEAQKEQARIGDLWYAFQSVIENIAGDETIEDKAAAITTATGEFKDMMADKSASIFNSMVSMSNAKIEPEIVHPLQEAIEKFKSDYDDAIGMTDITPDDKLRLVQESFNNLGQTVIDTMKTPERPKAETPKNDLADALALALQPLLQEMSLINTRLSSIEANKTVDVNKRSTTVEVPQRRSIAPTMQMQTNLRQGTSTGVQKSETPNLRRIIERST